MSLHVDTDAVLLIDAGNAFNSINRKVMLHNLKFICPIIDTYIINCYATPSRSEADLGLLQHRRWSAL